MIKPDEIPVYLEEQQLKQVEEIADLIGVYAIETTIDHWIAHYFNTNLQVATIPYACFVDDDTTDRLTIYGSEILQIALNTVYSEYWTVTRCLFQNGQFSFKFIPKAEAVAND